MLNKLNSQSALGVRLPILLIGAFAFMQVYAIQAILPLLLTDLNASASEGGLAVGATVLGMALLSPFIGMVSDGLGRKPMILSALLLLAVPTALMAFVSHIHELSALRLWQGLVVPAMTVTLIAYIGEEFEPEQVRRLMAVYVMGTVLGGFLGRFLLGHLSEWWGWQSALLVMAGLCVAGWLVVSWTLPPSKRFVPQANKQHALQTLKHHLHNPTLQSACALGFCVLFSLVGCFTFINLHLSSPPYQLGSGALANVFMVYLVGMVITPVSSWLMRRFGMRQSALVALLLSMSGLWLTVYEHLAVVVIGLVLMCSGVFIVQSATISHIALNIAEGRSLASGLYYTAYYLGGTVGAWLSGYAYRLGEWGAVVGLIIGIQCLAIMISQRSMK